VLNAVCDEIIFCVLLVQWLRVAMQRKMAGHANTAVTTGGEHAFKVRT
jgi:hypothetical protein